MNKAESRQHLDAWVREEKRYATQKFGTTSRTEHDAEMEAEQVGKDSWWYRQIHQYIDRARLFGVDTPQGRQALAKAMMTMHGAVESSVRVFGPLPAPGVTSGEISEWKNGPHAS